MTGFPNRKTVERLREQFKPGVTVELIKMDDPFAPPVGTRGKCLGVDDAGSVMVAWKTEAVFRSLTAKTFVRW